MASVNKVIILGRIGKDPELSYTPSGVPVCKFSVATSEKYTDKAGIKQEKTDWHNVVLWQKTAELAKQYCHKGSLIYIEGKIQTRSWDDKDGNKRYATEIVGNSIQFLDGKKADGAASEPRQSEVSEPPPQDDLPF